MMRKHIVMLAVGAAAFGAVSLSGCANGANVSGSQIIASQNVESHGIQVSGEETVKVTPDMAQISFGITTENAEAAACQQENADKLNQLLEYLKGAGIADSSIQTSQYSLEPRYDWSAKEQKIIGYRMQTAVVVTDVPVEQAGALLSGGAAAGANEINNVSYFSSKYDEAYNEALTKAVELARSKAQALAAAGGRELGEVLSIEEYSDSQYGRYVASNLSARSMAAESGSTDVADMSVMPGEMEVTAQISAEFAFAK